MVGIQGLGGIPEPAPERPAKTRNERDAAAASSAASAASGAGSADSQDGVVISSEAQAAAALGRVIQLTAEQAEVRAERIEAARENLERGDYKNPEVVRQVAERLLKYLS